jgi:hypothetical protein
MGAKYTEAQKRAILKYQKKFKRISVPLSEELHDKYTEIAKEQGISLSKYIIKLLEREYTRQHGTGSGDVVIQNEVETKITLTDEQIEALIYVKKLYQEFVSYQDFLWDWNWKSEGILNSFDTNGRTGAINKRLEAVGISPVQGINIEPGSVPQNNFNDSETERKKKHDEYLDIVLRLKKSMQKYFREIDELCGTDYSAEM